MCVSVSVLILHLVALRMHGGEHDGGTLQIHKLADMLLVLLATAQLNASVQQLGQLYGAMH
jgi:hypothetical protein